MAGWATSVGSWETFTWTAQSGSNFAIYSPASGFYASTNLNDNDYVQAEFATTPGTWEQYQWVDEGPAQ
jgi:hypothetical protein